MPTVINSPACSHGYSHRMAYASGARFCPGCGVRLEGPPADERPCVAGERGFVWSRAEPAPLGGGDVPVEIDTSHDGIRRFAAWRNFIVGVADTSAGPSIVLIRFVRRDTIPARVAGPFASVGPEGPIARRHEEPEVRLLWLDPSARGGGRGTSAAQVEPVIIQGLALLPIGRALVAVDLFSEEAVPKVVLRLEPGESFASTAFRLGDELLTVVRSAAGPRIVLIRPALDEKGVIKLGGEPWTSRAAAAEVSEGTFGRVAPGGAASPSAAVSPAPSGAAEAVALGRRAMLVGDSLYVPSRDSVLVATLTTAAGGGTRWVWRRMDRPDDLRAFADGRYAWPLGDEGAADPVVERAAGTGRDADEFDFRYESEFGLGQAVPGAGLSATGRPPASTAGILLKCLDADDEPVWSLLRPEPNGRLVLSRYPESEVMVAAGRIYGVSRKAHLTELQECDSMGGPRARRVYVTGVAVDRFLPVNDDLVTLVKDGQALKVWVYNNVGTLQGSHAGGQELLGQGESLCPPIWTEGRVVCVWTDSRQIFVASGQRADPS